MIFGRKKERVRFLRGIASADATFNAGDVAEVDLDVARAMIDAGHAEATAEPCGPAATPVEFKTCWRCGYEQSFYNPRCEHCGVPT